MLISLIPAIAFGAFDAIYVTYIRPDWYENYLANMTVEYEQAYSGAELEAKLEEMKSMEAFMTPAGTFFLMSMSIANSVKVGATTEKHLRSYTKVNPSQMSSTCL